MKGHELLLAFGMKGVAHTGTDQELDRDPQLPGARDHFGAGDKLFVLLAAVRADRHVEGVVDRVVNRERQVLIKGKRSFDLLILVEIDKPGPRPDRAPQRRVMQTE